MSTQSTTFSGYGGGGGGRSRSRSRSPSLDMLSAVKGARVHNQLRSYKRLTYAQRQLKRQTAGKNALHKFQRTLYSNTTLSSGDALQNIYIQSGTQPFRIYNTGTLAYQNADHFSIEFQPGTMVIHWYNGATLQTSYAYNMPSFTELTGLFDQMRIEWVEIEWFYGTTNSQTTGVTSTGVTPFPPTGEIYGNPMMIYVKDYDDSDALGTNPWTSLSQYENQKVWQLSNGYNDRRHVCRIRPKLCQTTTDDGGTATGVASVDTRNLWLDSVRGLNQPHYGIKGSVNLVSTVQSTSPANTFILGALGFRCTYHYSFKNVK